MAANGTAEIQLDVVPKNLVAEVLFCSALQPSDHPTPQQVRAAVLDCLRAHHDEPWQCTAQLAAAYGHHPELACARMRWCLQMVAQAA
jgi:hypothetical protein